MDETLTQLIVSNKAAVDPNQKIEYVAMFTDAGAPVSPFSGEATIFTPITTGSAIGTVGKSTSAAEPAAGSLVAIKFTNGNSAETPTLAFAGGTARAMKLGGTASAAAKLAVAANGVVLFFFDGTVLHQIGAYT